MVCSRKPDNEVHAVPDTAPCDPASIIGTPTIERLRASGLAVIPFDVPDYAVGEVMTWTGCSCPNLAWEAINCAINMIANRNADDNPEYFEAMRKLGSGEMSLADWREERKAASAARKADAAAKLAAEPPSTGGPVTAAERDTEVAELMTCTGGSRQEALEFWCEARFDLSDADRAFHLADGSKHETRAPEATETTNA
ncbi:MAG: hypothetical protein JWQ72_3275 [Polaromonas sp.]|nr:hypothetical protein [Polaromonas sp.]